MLGGVASGKSHVASRIRALAHAEVEDADLLAREELLRVARDGRLEAALGAGFVDADGRPRRDVIARRVFSEPSARVALERLVHPGVLQKIRDRILRHRRGEGASLLVLDVPLLAETGLDRRCDVLWFVEAPGGARRRRALERGMSIEQWEAREAAQMPLSTKRLRADAVVRNDDRLEERLRPLLQDLGATEDADGGRRAGPGRPGSRAVPAGRDEVPATDD